jgi:hypothetical protein
MENNLLLVINTCKLFFSNTTSLIQQINELGFPNKNVIIVSGQEDEETVEYINDIKIVKVKYTGINITSVIYVNENIDLFENIKYFLFLPDTIKFGENFFNLLGKYYELYLKNESIYSMPFINMKIRQTMDLGVIHKNQVLNLTDYLIKIKSYKTDIESLKFLKKKLIYDENTILGLPVIANHNNNLRSNHTSKLSKFVFGIFRQGQRRSVPKNAAIHPHNKLLNEKYIKCITNKKEDLKETEINNGKINEVYMVLLDLYKYQRNFDKTFINGNVILEL